MVGGACLDDIDDAFVVQIRINYIEFVSHVKRVYKGGKKVNK